MKTLNIPPVPKSVVALAALGVAGIYLFATAPADLQAQTSKERDVPVETLFRLLDAENASVRALYTREIVTPGLKAGLKFDEDWRMHDIHAGPLPALLLRETANRMQQRVPDLSLFLGSEFPIQAANKFKGEQIGYFAKVNEQRAPQFFLDRSTGRYTAMFPDIASAEGCVKCHNDHAKSPRKDWKLNDVMGATTWSFARERVSTAEMVDILGHYRASAIEAYSSYLKKTEAFPERKPQLGAQWPKDGLFLPDAETFRQRMESNNSVASLNLLLQSQSDAGKSAVAASDTQAPKKTSAGAGSTGGKPATKQAASSESKSHLKEARL